jgi:hypothetical protein
MVSISGSVHQAQSIRSKFAIVLCLGLSVGFVTPLMADCLSCFELRGCRVVTDKGQSESGYVRWFFSAFGENAPFPEALIDKKWWRPIWKPPTLQVYRDVHKVTPPGTFVVKKSDVLEFAYSEIDQIVADPKEHDGVQGAGGLHEVSDHAFELLTGGDPVATLRHEMVGFDWHLISFNPDFANPELERILQVLLAGGPEQPRPRWEEWEDQDIVVLAVGFD